MTRTPWILSISLITLALLGGCAGLLTSREPVAVTYLLRPPIVSALPATSAASPQPPTATAMAMAMATLQVQRVVAYPGYEGDRILLTRPEQRLDVYAGSRWSASLPKVVEAMTLDALRASGAFAAVHDSLAPYATDYLLRVSIRRFEAEYEDLSAAPRVRISFEVSVSRRKERQTLQSFSIETTAVAESNRMSAIVAAFEQASAAALAQVVSRTRETLARSP